MIYVSEEYGTDQFDGMKISEVKEAGSSRFDKWLFSYDFVVVLENGVELKCRKSQIES